MNAAEFEELIGSLADDGGVLKLQEGLIRANAVVSRRRGGSLEALSRQLYLLTVGLEREGLPARVLLALWEEKLAGALDEETSVKLDEIAGAVNECLDGEGHIVEGREADLRASLGRYRGALADKVGYRTAHLTMLLRSFPDVARLLRAGLDSADGDPEHPATRELENEG